MNVLSLNIRGYNGGEKSSWVRDLKKRHYIGAVALQETKKGILTDLGVANYWGPGNFKMEYVSSSGQSGGLLWIWDPAVLEVESTVKERNFLLLKGKLIGSGEQIFLFNVYAPQKTTAKRRLWSDIAANMEGFGGLFLLVGDFNIVRSLDERKGSNFKATCARNFNDFIFNSGLVEYPLQGKKFTCSRENGKKLSKLDRFLVCDNFFNKWLDACVRVLPGYLSDHSPIVLSVVDLKYRPKPFRENELISSALIELERLEQEMENRELEEEEQWILAENRKGIKEIEARRNSDVKQRSRVKWSIDGDENSRFFHSVINKRKALNKIQGLNIDSAWISKPAKVKKHIFAFFRDKFGEDLPDRPDLICENFKQLSDEDKEFLVSPFTSTEIKDVRGVFNSGSGSSFITLVPKIKDPVSINNYRPINLVGVVSKVISKALANRMKEILSKVISVSQSAFIKGKCILDGPLIVGEILSWLKKKKVKLSFSR
ncbi:uncharacterized protein LOC110888021 [Helianthus annuus]|uniref:uncharacterized protein LOC110888021 n=1 Tax=Helianthus annuus TaxID=4232 RepID=UPI000B905CB7|nr:uncharacterized protein LOC110888021 [Helianthus annuus]